MQTEPKIYPLATWTPYDAPVGNDRESYAFIMEPNGNRVFTNKKWDETYNMPEGTLWGNMGIFHGTLIYLVPKP